MTEEDFEIDIYGDGDGDDGDGGADHGGHKHHDPHAYRDEGDRHEPNGHGDYDEVHPEDMDTGHGGHDEPRDRGSRTPSLPAPQQGVKRKEGSDDRPVDPGATSAVMISDLNWWHTDDDVRGWIRDASCEGELKEIAFSEHKVNGKSKGQTYIVFTSQQAATALKHRVDSLSSEDAGPGQKKHPVIYQSPTVNPFKTLPKDVPARGGKDGQPRVPSGPGYQERSNNMGGGNFGAGGGGYRGRGGFNNPRGGMGSQGGFHRNYGGNNMNSFNSNNNNNMGFNNPMGGGGGGNFAGFRGGGMMGGGGGMQGGRGGMRGRGGGGMGGGMNGMMGGMGSGMQGGMGPMPMGPMGGMPGGMGGMGMMGGGMGFQGMQPQFNPGFFGGGGNQSGNSEWQNPHGAKRPRPE